MSLTLISTTDRSPFTQIAEGVEASRSIADSAVCDLGGGHLRFVADGVLEGTLEYDEVVYVLVGSLSLTVEEKTAVAGPGDILVLTNGTTATYRAVAGTELFYVLNPRPRS